MCNLETVNGGWWWWLISSSPIYKCIFIFILFYFKYIVCMACLWHVVSTWVIKRSVVSKCKKREIESHTKHNHRRRVFRNVTTYCCPRSLAQNWCHHTKYKRHRRRKKESRERESGLWGGDFAITLNCCEWGFCSGLLRIHIWNVQRRVKQHCIRVMDFG